MGSPVDYRRVARVGLQKLQPKSLGQETVVGHSRRWSAGALAPTSEVLFQACDHERVHLSIGTARVAVAEVALPAFQRLVHFPNQLVQGHEALLRANQFRTPRPAPRPRL